MGGGSPAVGGVKSLFSRKKLSQKFQASNEEEKKEAGNSSKGIFALKGLNDKGS